ncbi:MAG: hypothetical protein QF415_16650 [Candidatus Undinarchaeales archaeon]|jgi:hypothetical protein|nr:hypothetical protein [Candidatus Undinarchaeales archaeon]MDP7492349.1 hypothetical protein [Candidatus Undinarchaeales archaeon]
MHRARLLFALALALVTLCASVETVDSVRLSVKAMKGAVMAGEDATYEVVVENRYNGSMEIVLTPKGSHPTWVRPSMDHSFTLASGGRRGKNILSILPPNGTRSYTYAFSVSMIARHYNASRNLVAESRSEDEFYVQVLPPPPPEPTPEVIERVEVTVVVVTPTPTPVPTPEPVFNPSLSLSLRNPGPFYPEEGIDIDIIVENAVNIEVGSLDVDVQIVDIHGDIIPPIIRRTPVTVHKDGGTLSASHSVTLERDIVPGDYTITVSVMAGGLTIGPESLGFTVGIKSGVDVFPVIEKEMMRKKTTYRLRNKGNTPTVYPVQERIPWYLDIFTIAEPRPTRKVSERNAYLYVWDVSLDPLQEAEVHIEVSYIPFLAVTVAIVLAAIFVLQTSRALTLEKEISIKKNKRGEEYASISIHLRNFSERAIANVSVIDRVPLMAKISRSFPTLKPTTIQRGEQWTEVIWTVERLEPKEERVFSYSMTSVIEVIGTVDLPPARILHSRPDGRKIDIESNPVSWEGAAEE